jgi:hypothetical protein
MMKALERINKPKRVFTVDEAIKFHSIGLITRKEFLKSVHKSPCSVCGEYDCNHLAYFGHPTDLWKDSPKAQECFRENEKRRFGS